MGRRTIPLQTKAEGLRLAAAGLPSRAVAAVVRVHHATVCRWIQAAGILVVVKEAPRPCAHSAIIMPGRVCQDCGVALPPPSPPRPADPPGQGDSHVHPAFAWVREATGSQESPIIVQQPSWRLDRADA